jgi:type IV secretion system protein VirB10
MLILGAGMLTWYYTNAISQQSRTKRTAQSAALHRAQGEMPLPALGGFDALRMSSPALQHQAADSPPSAQLPAPEQPQLPLMPSQANWGPMGPSAAPYDPAAHKSAKQLMQERLLAGAAFARESESRATVTTSATPLPNSSDAYGSEVIDTSSGKSGDASGSEASVAPFLRPTAIASARAKVLPTRRFLLPKGAFIDCTLETAIDSTLPGMTTCITATDTFGADGTVVLLERGTKLIGETRGQVQQGAARVFVLWTEARTPTGIAVPLDSPGADELGRSGLPGSVNRHFWDRFGAAILISTLDGGVQAAVESASRSGGPVIYNPSSSESVLTDVLKGSINIPPTVTKPNGDRIQVFVARDVDFRSVYELRSVAPAR